MYKKYNSIFLVFLLTMSFTSCDYSRAEIKRDLGEDNRLPNVSGKSMQKTPESQSPDKSGLIFSGKWMASPDSDENFDYFTYQVIETDFADSERMMTLRVFDYNEKEIYKEVFNKVNSIYPAHLLNNEREQLVLHYNLGGSGIDLKIFALQEDKKVRSIVENDRIHTNGNIAFIPLSSQQVEPESPLQLLDIGTLKATVDKRKIVRVFRYKNDKYRFYGSGYYEDIVKSFDNSIQENSLIPANNLLKR